MTKHNISPPFTVPDLRAVIRRADLLHPTFVVTYRYRYHRDIFPGKSPRGISRCYAALSVLLFFQFLLLICYSMDDTITFGPSGQEWHYSKTTKTYDLSGGSVKKLTFPTSEGPKETSITISPESSALVIVDMQNFFLDPKCRDHPNGLKAVEPTIKVIEKCRAAGIQVYDNLYLFPESLSTYESQYC